MVHIDLIWRVAISSLRSTNVVKLSNPHNSNYEALRSTSLDPGRRKVGRDDEYQKEHWSDLVPMKLEKRHIGT